MTVRRCANRGTLQMRAILWEVLNPYIDYLFKEYVRKGIEQPGAKAVIRIDSNGNEKEYPYLSAVEQDGYDPSNVSRVCRGITNRAYGFQWRFKKPESTIENTPDGGSE